MMKNQREENDQQLVDALAQMEEGAEKQAVRRKLAKQLLLASIEELPDGSWSRDLRGVGCPLVWAKARITLEHLPHGELLRLKIDPEDPIENVPRSLAAEGFILLERSRLSDGGWELLIRKP